MSDPLVFMMGEFTAEFPQDRQYANNHMWAQPHGDGLRFGFTAYAVRLLQDVYFLDWLIDSGVELARRQEIGSIESKKAESALYAPISGTLTGFNDRLLSDPSGINIDKYGAGWLFTMQPNGAPAELLTATGYVELLDEVWAVTQRTIKGQLN